MTNHSHPGTDPTMRTYCEPCGIVHAMAYDRKAGRYVCPQTFDVTNCLACQASNAYWAAVDARQKATNRNDFYRAALEANNAIGMDYADARRAALRVTRARFDSATA